MSCNVRELLPVVYITCVASCTDLRTDSVLCHSLCVSVISWINMCSMNSISCKTEPVNAWTLIVNELSACDASRINSDVSCIFCLRSRRSTLQKWQYNTRSSGTVRICLHVTTSSLWSSKSPSKFNIVFNGDRQNGSRSHSACQTETVSIHR